MMVGPLDGIRVLELGQFLSAPRCGRILAEQGADVVKIEPPAGEQLRLLLTLVGADKSYAIVNAGKRGLTLDLKRDEGRDVFRELVKSVDVVVENLAPGALERMGLGYRVLSELNPRLVLCSISGFGQDGPLSDRLAFDIIAQATSGVMHGQGQPEKPPAIFFGDLVSGAYAAMGVAFALLARERTGRGQHVDVSMQEVMYAQHFGAHSQRALGDDEERIAALLGRSLHQIITSPDDPLPFWAVYPATDGHVAVVALTDGHWQRLMKVIGQESLGADGRFATFIDRVRNAREGREVVRAWTAGKSVDEIVTALAAGGVPCGRVATEEQVHRDPHLEARGMLARIGAGDDEVRVPGPVPRTRGASAGQRRHPGLSEHTDEVLSALAGLDDDAIAGLRAAGVV